MDLDDVINAFLIYEIDRRLAYSLAYGGVREIQERIDEEGSGPVFAAYKGFGECGR